MVRIIHKSLIENSFLAVGFLTIAFFYYWINWSTEVPVLGGDHAVYLLMADHLSPFSDRSHDVTLAAMPHVFFPPLYPLILGIAGGTSAHVEIAHAVTISFLTGVFVCYFVWVRKEAQSLYQAFLLTVVFAFLPATFFQSFGILSENLYLLLTLVAIWLMSESDIPMPRLYAASVVIGLAVITRTIGITLVATLAIHLFIFQRGRWVRPVVLSLIPLVVWNIAKWLLGYTGGYLWIVTSVAHNTSPWDLLFKKLFIENHGLWAGWIISFDPVPSLMTLIVGSVIAVICLFGTFHRAFLRKFDGIYLILYLVVLLMWPSSPDARRFLYPALPILLFHGFTFTYYLAQRISSSMPAIYVYAYLFVIVLVAFPAIESIFQRMAMAQDVKYKGFANSVYWYSGGDLDRTQIKIKAYKKLIQSWQRISETIPVGECVYDVDPVWFMLYANRPAYSPPQAATKEQFLKDARRCRYVYVASYTRPPYQLFYPIDYIMNEGKIIFSDRMDDMAGMPVLSMLIELPKEKE